MQRALILGLGLSGQAAVELLLRDGYEIFVVDDCAEKLLSQESCVKLVQQGVRIADQIEGGNLSAYEVLVVSPGVSPHHPIYQEARARGMEILGEAQLALRKAKQPCIGISGTNGKTTTTFLVEHILRTAGLKARALGNIGVPLSSYFVSPDPQEILVVELSSYQLETMHIPALDVGVILNITPDHLDRYGSMQEYARAKCRMQLCIKPQGQLYVHRRAAVEFSDFLRQGTFSTFGSDEGGDYFTNSEHAENRLELMGATTAIEYYLPSSYREKGIHESENALAAWLMVKPFGVTEVQFVQALQSFSKPAHRIEHVKTVRGVEFYNDSKGTNVDAVIRAVEAMHGGVYLIAGGVDKGSSYRLWEKTFSGKVKRVFAMGQARQKIMEEVQEFCDVQLVDTLEEAVHCAASFAKDGECVLLSPGCSSFDMFRDYVHRGEEFKRLLMDLDSSIR